MPTPEINPNKDMPALNPSSTGGVNPDDLMSEIQSRLLGSAGAISSSSSKLEDMITGAISKVSESNTAAKTATESAYNRELDTTKLAAANSETSFLEAQRGYATNTAALKDLRTSNEKSIRDLEQRKQEALLAADSATASKISDLMIKKYEFEQDAQQKVFSNLISLSNFGLQRAQEKRLQQTQNFTEDSAKQQVALKYGVEVKAGDTLQDVVNRAKPFASKEQQLQLDKMQADLELTKANTKKAYADAEKAIKDKNAQDLTGSDFDVFIKAAVASNADTTADELKAKIQGISGLSATQRKAGYDAVDAYFASKKNESSGSSVAQPFNSPIANTAYGAGQVLGSIGQTVLDFIFGGGSKADTIYSSPFRK